MRQDSWNPERRRQYDWWMKEHGGFLHEFKPVRKGNTRECLICADSKNANQHKHGVGTGPIHYVKEGVVR